jgi:hypothetical protein
MLTFGPLVRASALTAGHRNGPDGGRGEVDRPDARLGVAGRVGRVRLGRRRLEDEVGQVRLRQQPVDASRGGFDAGGPGAGQAVGPGIDADHRDHLDPPAALQLGEQVGPDVARSDDRRRERGAHRVLRPIRVVRVPSPPNCAETTEPAVSGCAAVSEPGMTT